MAQSNLYLAAAGKPKGNTVKAAPKTTKKMTAKAAPKTTANANNTAKKTVKKTSPDSAFKWTPDSARNIITDAAQRRTETASKNDPFFKVMTNRSAKKKTVNNKKPAAQEPWMLTTDRNMFTNKPKLMPWRSREDIHRQQVNNTLNHKNDDSAALIKNPAALVNVPDADSYIGRGINLYDYGNLVSASEQKRTVKGYQPTDETGAPMGRRTPDRIVDTVTFNYDDGRKVTVVKGDSHYKQQLVNYMDETGRANYFYLLGRYGQDEADKYLDANYKELDKNFTKNKTNKISHGPDLPKADGANALLDNPNALLRKSDSPDMVYRYDDTAAKYIENGMKIASPRNIADVYTTTEHMKGYRPTDETGAPIGAAPPEKLVEFVHFTFDDGQTLTVPRDRNSVDYKAQLVNFMDDISRGNYYYLLGKHGEDEADKYLNAQYSMLDAGLKSRITSENAADFTERHPIIANSLLPITGAAESFSPLNRILARLSGDEDAGEDVDYYTPSVINLAIEGESKEKIRKKTGDGFFGTFGSYLYDSYALAAENSAAVPLNSITGTTGASGAMVAGRAMSRNFLGQILNGNYGDKGKYFSSVVAGLASGLLYSDLYTKPLHRLANRMMTKFIPAEKSLSRFVREEASNALSGAGINLSRNIADNVADKFVNGEYSNYLSAKKRYVQSGMSDGDARDLAIKTEIMNPLISAVVIGGIMGIFMGAPSSAEHAVDFSTLGKKYKSKSQDIISEGLSYDRDTAAWENAGELFDAYRGDKKISDNRLGAQIILNGAENWRKNIRSGNTPTKNNRAQLENANSAVSNSDKGKWPKKTYKFQRQQNPFISTKY